MSSRDVHQSYYDVLEVSPAAPHHEIVKAYERAKSTYSPDSPALYTMFTKEEAAELRELIEEAFIILSNQAKRREYDEKLHQAKTTDAATAQDLPDFPPAPEVQLKTPEKEGATVATMPDLDRSGQLPDGFKRSRLSVYDVKHDVEEEIANCKDYDGAFIRKIRLYKNINLDQMSKETRISRTYIAAVESNDFEALPAPVFVRGFVIQIALVLALDENLVASSYMEKVPKENP